MGDTTTEDSGPPPAKAPRKNRWDTASSSATANPADAAATGAAPLSVKPEALGASVQAAKERAKEALAKAQLAAEVQRALQQHLPTGVGVNAAAATVSAPKPAVVTIDAQGRLLDERGKLIQSTARPQASIKVNQSARTNPLLEQAPPPDPTANNKYYDPRMALPGQGRDQRKKRAFSFVPEGHFSRKADDMRAKAAVELMLEEASKPAAKRRAAASALAVQRASAASTLMGSEGHDDGALGASTAVSSATLERRLAEVPAAEWWDLPLLGGPSYTGPPGDSVEANAVLDGISHLVEHPVPILPPAGDSPPAGIGSFPQGARTVATAPQRRTRPHHPSVLPRAVVCSRAASTCTDAIASHQARAQEVADATSPRRREGEAGPDSLWPDGATATEGEDLESNVGDEERSSGRSIRCGG